MQGADSIFTQNLSVDESIMVSKDKFHSSLTAHHPSLPPKKNYMGNLNTCIRQFLPLAVSVPS
jgi:hypothetical protein